MNLSFLQNTCNTIRKNFKEIRECIHDKMVKKDPLFTCKKTNNNMKLHKLYLKILAIIHEYSLILIFLHDLLVFSVYFPVFPLFLL